MDCIGHDDIIDFFDTARTAGRLHHAYLFVGRRGLGKYHLATQIAADVFGQSVDKLATNPDIFLLSRGIHEKTGKTKKNISIDDVAELRHFLQSRPFVHKNKIAIVDGADLLSAGAMNSLLKTLEEPRGDVHIFLIVESEDALLETIRSRCHTIYFHAVDDETLISYALGAGQSEETAREMARHAAGLPGRMVEWVAEEASYNRYTQEVSRYQSLIGVPLYEQLAQVEELFTKKEDHIAARSALLEILDIWLETLYRSYHSSQTALSYDIVETYQALLQAKSQLTKNIHPRLLIEHILLTLSHP